MNHEKRKLELRTLLTNWRARLRPQDVGLPMTPRRRVVGLRREEVAELVGVSPNWYAMFETGGHRRRFSAAFVQRVAETLLLDERERASLFRLALPEVRIAVEQFERSAGDGVLRSLSCMRTLVARASAAGSFEEASRLAVEALMEALKPTSVSVAILVPEHVDRVIADGPRAHRELVGSVVADTCMVANYPNRYGDTTYSENRSGYEETAGGAFRFRQRTAGGQSFLVAVTPDSPTARQGREAREHDASGDAPDGGALRDATLNAFEYWDWNSKLDARSVLTHGLFTAGRYRGNLCALWTQPRSIERLEIETVRTASAIVELAAAASDNR
jgi:transcriptional regulator with XRE-family HTH domain